MKDILLITPPLVQPNTPYPATAYLKGYLQRKGINAEQFDLSIELLGRIFSQEFLIRLFENGPADETGKDSDCNINRIYNLRRKYISSIDTVVRFLRGGDPSLAQLICTPEFIPQAYRFENIADLEEAFGSLGTADCAKYISTLYLQDLSDYIRATVTPHFEIVRYAEKLSVAVPSFHILEEQMAGPPNIIEREMLSLLENEVERHHPRFVGFTIPFPGNLLSSLKCASYIKGRFPDIKIIAGGGYPTTELRDMSDKGIFRYFDYLVLDDGELALERILKNDGPLVNTYTKDGFHRSDEKISHLERGCPDFSGLAYGKYFSLCEVINPMHRLWTDGLWNKMVLSHGCYWAKCVFCDTSLDYIKCFDMIPAAVVVDWMERVYAQTGSGGFHFVDEAAPPKLLKEISLELIRRGLNFPWWTNIRFEKAFTGDLCRLMAAAGCVAVSGGLEAATDRLLGMVDKGVTVETATMTLRNFYYAGIMTHAYLMYGLPTQTLQETVDSLEIVRQMFRAELIESAFWHRYAMTVHSPSGINPEKFGVKRKNDHVNTFANNEIRFVEDRGYNIHAAGEALRTAVQSYMAGEGQERPAHKWFEGKVPPTTVEATEITDHLIKPDSSRIYDDAARLVWIGFPLAKTDEGILADSPSRQKSIKLSECDSAFLLEITSLCSDLDKTITLREVKQIYESSSEGSFMSLYHSKKWDILREFGLLQI